MRAESELTREALPPLNTPSCYYRQTSLAGKDKLTCRWGWAMVTPSLNFFLIIKYALKCDFEPKAFSLALGPFKKKKKKSKVWSWTIKNNPKILGFNTLYIFVMWLCVMFISDKL